jgi:uncharacterized protein (AIM24 family)
MIHMAASVQLSGQVKFSMKKMFTGGQMAESVLAGPGKVSLAPTMFGDIVTLHLDGRTNWKIGKDVFLACTPGVSKETKSQGFSKTLFSGEDMFIYHTSGQGLMWLTSFGAVDRLEVSPLPLPFCVKFGRSHVIDSNLCNGVTKSSNLEEKLGSSSSCRKGILKIGQFGLTTCEQLRPGEQHIVDNGHLVAWSCDYKIEKAGGGSMTSLKTGEGLVCRFTGPGSVYVQTRNFDDFTSFIRSVAGPRE